MDRIINKKLKDLKQDDNLTPFQYLRAKDHFSLEGETYQITCILDLNFKQVVAIKRNIKDPFKLFDIIFDLKPYQVEQLRLIDFYSFLTFIYEQVEDLTAQESVLSLGKSSPLDSHGFNAVIDFLAGEDVSKWQHIEEHIPYNIILSKLKLEKDKSSMRSRQMDMLKNKSNHK